jgi:hypothetical protein
MLFAGARAFVSSFIRLTVGGEDKIFVLPAKAAARFSGFDRSPLITSAALPHSATFAGSCTRTRILTRFGQLFDDFALVR